MKLQGSCHCGAVRFSVEAPHPAPFNQCYCGICRKTAGAGGYAINIGALADTLEVEGRDNISVYRAEKDGKPSNCDRSFCGKCGSQLWVFSPDWPDLLHPHASAIDTDLPTPPEHTHMMLGSKANWVDPAVGANDRSHDAYPEESLAQWHERNGMAR